MGEARRGDAVGTREHHADRGAGAHRPRRRVGADVLHVVDRGGKDDAVVVEGHPGERVLVAGLAGCEQVLAAILDPLDRAGQLRRDEHEAHLFALRHHLLSEAATGVAHHDADPVLGEAEHTRAHRAHLVRRLRRRPDRELLARGRQVLKR